MKLDLNRISQLLDVEEKTRLMPKLNSLYQLAMLELDELEANGADELVVVKKAIADEVARKKAVDDKIVADRLAARDAAARAQEVTDRAAADKSARDKAAADKAAVDKVATDAARKTAQDKAATDAAFKASQSRHIDPSQSSVGGNPPRL